MSIYKVLQKEGIELLSIINDKKVASISSKISNRICNAFPEHNLNKDNLYSELSKISMYFANFKSNNIGAKYYYKNKTIYFNRKYNSKKLSDLAIHECIHFIQEKRNKNGSLNRFGLYCLNKVKPTGMALNEAAVQLMSIKANKSKPDFVKYYGLSLFTPSPDYYPIECALLNQISYFIGTYPIFHSTLYSDDVFKTTFITKTNKKTYKIIENSFDNLVEYEEELSKLLYSLSQNDDVSIAQNLNKKIEETKNDISKLTLYIQELIIKSCFESELENAKTITDINNLKHKLLHFKKYLIQTDNYNFYDLFSCEFISKLNDKKSFIENYGIKAYYSNTESYLPILSSDSYGINFFKKLYIKTKKLFKENKAVSKNLN